MSKAITTVFAVALATVAMSSCGNTIRGMGQDTANTVNATQDAGNRVGNAAAR
jgi:entericidin B